MSDVEKTFKKTTLIGRFAKSRSDKRKKEMKKIEDAQRAQANKQKLALAEASSDVARRRLSAGSGGRKSLIQTSPTGLKTNLGG